MRMSVIKMAALTASLLTAGCVSAPAPETAVGDYLAGRLAARINAVDDAALAFGQAQDVAPDANEILRRAFFYQLVSGDVERAATLGARIITDEDVEDDDLPRLAIAAKSLNDGEYTATRAILAPGAQIGYFSAAMTIIDAWALAGSKGPEEALRALAVSDEQEDTFRGFHPLHQAFLFENAGLMDEADTAYQLALMSYGGAVGRDAYGAFLERAGDDEQAREHYELLDQYPGPDRKIAQQGMARLAGGKQSDEFENVTPSQGAAIALYSFGAAILQQTVDQRDAAEKAGFRVGDANYDMPLAMTQIALYLYPSFDHAQRLAGSILNSYGDNEKAIEMLQTIPASSPFFEQAQIEIAGGMIALERDDEALSVLRKALRRSPNADEARFSYANLLARQKRHRDAVKAFSRLIDKLPEDPPGDAWRYYIGRAASYLAIDEWPSAEDDLKRAVEIAPEEAVALNYLGYSWAERGENLDEAFALIEKAVALEPNSGAYIDSLGWAHYQRGDYETAVGHLEHAVSLEPADTTITDHLGDVYWRLGRVIEARYQWRQVLELEPDEKLRAAVERKLKDGLPEAPKAQQ